MSGNDTNPFTIFILLIGILFVIALVGKKNDTTNTITPTNTPGDIKMSAHYTKVPPIEGYSNTYKLTIYLTGEYRGNIEIKNVTGSWTLIAYNLDDMKANNVEIINNRVFLTKKTQDVTLNLVFAKNTKDLAIKVSTKDWNDYIVIDGDER